MHHGLWVGSVFSSQLISPTIGVWEGKRIMDYGLARSFRRSAMTHAQNQGVSATDIDWIMRWNDESGGQAGGPMRKVYTEMRQTMETFLRFSQAL